MNVWMLTGLMFGSMLGLFMLNVPIAFAMGATSLVFALMAWGPNALKVVTTTIMSSLSSFILLAIPLFLLMGQVLVRSGLGESMFQAVYVLAGRVRGGLAASVIAVCSMLAAMVGIIGAGVITAGTVALPPMLRRGYDKRLALGSVMAGGSLGILIPPSIPMVLYSAIAKTSLGKLFAGALVPGLLLAACHCLYILVYCRLKPEAGPAIDDPATRTPRARLLAVRDAMASMGLIVAVLGTILGGIATPTEGAAVGVVATLLLCLLYRRAGFMDLVEASRTSVRLLSVVVWMLIGASIMANLYMLMGGRQIVTALTSIQGLEPIAVVVAMMAVMLVLGLFLDDYVIVFLCAPLFVPIVQKLGFDPVWFGVLMILNLVVAVQTPPYGFALFYLKAVAPPDVSSGDLYRAVVPFVLITIFVMGLCIAFPELVLWLPNRLFAA